VSTGAFDPNAPGAQVQVGMSLGRYQLRERLGAGGMGVVFAAYDPELDRTVAVKVLHRELNAGGSAGEERLRREGQTMARVVHPNVIRVYDVGVDKGICFVAMEYVRGGTLQDRLDTGRGTEEILNAFLQAGRGLAAAHDAGLVHRDFKPANVLCSDDGRVLVTDFGLARASADADANPEVGAGAVEQTITRVGTPAYMSPEQHRGELVDARADQFSFCVALWRALFGTPPYSGDSGAELADAIANGRLANLPVTAKVPAYVRTVLARGLAANPEDRFPSMRALLDALSPERPRRRRRRAAVLVGAVLAAGVVMALAVARRDPCRSGADRFVGVWDADTRRQLHDAFSSTGVSYAEASFREVARQLDARTAAWNLMRRQSCEATRVRKAQSDAVMDARAVCLERRYDELAAFVGVMRHVDAATLQTAVQAASALGDVTPCGDVDAIARRAPMPSDPARREATTALARELADLRARVFAGKTSIPETEVARIVERARATGYSPLLAEALAVEAELNKAQFKHREAVKLLEESVLAAEAGGDDELRFADEVELTNLVGNKLERDVEGQHHAKLADALLRRLGPEPAKEADLQYAMGQVSWWNGRYADARRQVERSIALREQVDPTGVKMARHLHVLGIIQQDQKDDEASLTTLARARKIAEAAMGAEHPFVAQIWETAGGSLRRLNRYDEAEQYLLRGLAILEAAAIKQRGAIGTALQNLGTLYLSQGKLEQAIDYLRRSVDLLGKAFGPEHTRIADALEPLGGALSRAGRHEEAEAVLLKSVAMHRKIQGATAPTTASSLKHLGDVYDRAGQPGRAVPQYEAAVHALEESQGKDSSLLARPLTSLGDAWTKLGKPERAVGVYERALAVLSKPGEQEGLHADLEFDLARVLVSKDRARAIDSAKHARARYAAIGAPAKEDLAKVDAWLAQRAR
jgi:tetratricopeptide (TPR) repeat protein